MSAPEVTARGYRPYTNTGWRQLANTWPIAMIAVGAIISVGWAVVLLWLMLGLLNLAL
jgi:hypothetical protein